MALPDMCRMWCERASQEGLVSLHVLRSYVKAVGPLVSASVLLSLLCMQLSRNASDWWLSVWTGSNGGGTSTSASGAADSTPGTLSWHETNGWFLAVLGALAAFNAVATAARSGLFAWGGLRGAVRIHNSLLASILSTSVAFFDVTPVSVPHTTCSHSLLSLLGHGHRGCDVRVLIPSPCTLVAGHQVGRIVNRFSRDQYSVDESLPFMLNIFLAQVRTA